MMRNKESKKNSTEQLIDQEHVANEQLVVNMQEMRRKALLTGASALLVVVLILGAVLAWYTRLTNVTGMTFDVATFDITATYLTESYILNPFDYSEILDSEDSLSAPGVKGYIPVEVTTTADNEVEVNYRLNIDTGSMASEFQERIRFYYYTYEDGAYVEHDLGFGEDDIMGTLPIDEDSVIEHIYWEWVYEGDISTVLISPADMYSSSDSEIQYNVFDSLDEMTNEEIYYAIYNWRKSNNDEVDAYYSELEAVSIVDSAATSGTIDKLYDGTSTTATSTYYGSTTYQAVSATEDNYESKRGANLRDYLENHVLYEWDYADTQVAIGAWDEAMTSSNGSIYTDETITSTITNADGSTTEESTTYYAYQMAMQVSIEVTGVQAEPLDEGEESAYPEGGGTVKYGSADES